MNPYRTEGEKEPTVATPLPAYNSIVECPKCGASVNSSRKLCTGRACLCKERREHFHVRCDRYLSGTTNGCGWRAVMAAKDAKS